MDSKLQFCKQPNIILASRSVPLRLVKCINAAPRCKPNYEGEAGNYAPHSPSVPAPKRSHTPKNLVDNRRVSWKDLQAPGGAVAIL